MNASGLFPVASFEAPDAAAFDPLGGDPDCAFMLARFPVAGVPDISSARVVRPVAGDPDVVWGGLYRHDLDPGFRRPFADLDDADGDLSLDDHGADAAGGEEDSEAQARDGSHGESP
jgi:hypothetical protein